VETVARKPRFPSIRVPSYRKHGMLTQLLTATALASPASHWPLDGSLDDDLAGQDGAVQGTVAYAPGVISDGVTLDGTGGGRVPDHPLIEFTTDFTVSAWVRPEAIEEMAVACRWGDGGLWSSQHGWCLVLEPNAEGTALRANFRASSLLTQGDATYEEMQGATDLAVGEWVHVAGSFWMDGLDTQRQLFVDATLDATRTDSGLLAIPSITADLGLGLRAVEPTVDDLHFEGAIDEIRIDQPALDALELDVRFDLDGDGLGDADDTDDDGDGVDDASDEAPRVPTACRDTDADQCDDCSSGADDPTDDGADTDADGVCDLSDPTVYSSSFDTDDAPWTSGGIGAPSIVYDSASGLLVMAYETQTGTDASCPVGTWALGLATSSDGTTWTDLGGALLAPTADTFYSCVAAHPGLVDRFPGTLVLFFKGEQGTDACDVTTPSWGCDQYTGVGRATLTWNAQTSAYELTGPATEPALAVGEDFGYPKGVHRDGVYHVTYVRAQDLYAGSGTADLDVVTGPLWSAGDASWASDEIRSPSTACDVSHPFHVHLQGSDTLGRLDGSTPDNLTEGVGEVWNASLGDPELRHHDAVSMTNGGWLVAFSTRDGPGGSMRIRLAASTAGWTPADLRSKTCP